MTRLFIDQYGNHFRARTVKELRSKVPGRCSRMFQDTLDGKTLHTGYVIGQHWLQEYAPVQREVTL